MNKWIKIKRILNEATVGKEQDFTKIPLRKAIFLLSVPMVIEMLMESVFAVVDIYFVSRLGADAVTTVGLTESMMAILYAIALGVAMSTTALVARRVGERKFREASKDGLQSLFTGIALSILIAVPCTYFSSDLLRLMGASAEVIRYSSYTAIMFGGNIVIILLFILNAVFRGAGNAAIAMRVLLLANGLNIILDPMLIFGYGPFPAMGVTGAAIATNIGRGVAVIYQLYILFTGKSLIHLGSVPFVVQWKRIYHLLRISVGGIGQMLIATTSWIFLVRILSVFGTQVVAGYTIAIRILMFTILPAWGLSNAASTLVGQNLGAKAPERAEKAVWAVAKINIVFIGVVSLFFYFMPEMFLRIFTDDLHLIRIGSDVLHILSYTMMAYALGMVLTQAFNGAGDTLTTTKVNFIAYWIFELPCAYLLAEYTFLQEKGVYRALIISNVVMVTVAWYYFRKGKWKRMEL